MTARTPSFFYFAYGSNLYSKRIRIDNPSAVAKSVGLLKGYKLEFTLPSHRWKGSVANIVQDEASHVYGVIWELNTQDLPSLDKQEGVHAGIYERFEVLVEEEASNGSPISCLSYRLTAQTRQKGIAERGTDQKPSPAYKTVILNGAKENNLPKDYIKFLESIVDNGYQGEIDLNLNILKS